MATTTVNYSSNTAITMDLASLASSATFVAGRQSVQVDNTTNKYMDAMVSGFVSVGTTPTANKTIAVYVWGSDTSLGTTPINTITGADTTITLGNTGILNALRFGAAVSVPAATSDFQYAVLPFSVAALFGGVMPKYWGLFVAHDTGVNLRATLNTNSFEFVGVKFDTV